MIKELIKEIDSETLKNKENNVLELRLIVTDSSVENEMFKQALIKKSGALGIPINMNFAYTEDYAITPLQDSEGVLILKPQNKHDKETERLYKALHNCYNNYDKIDMYNEQRAVVKSNIDIIEKLGEKMNILIIGRSKDLAIPLANKLTLQDHTVMVAHTQTDLKKIHTHQINSIYSQLFDAVILATSSRLKDEQIRLLPDISEVIIDVNGQHDDLDVMTVGALTTSNVFNILMRGE